MSDKTETVVEQVTADDLDNLLGTPGADAAMISSEPAEDPDKPRSFFQKEKVDMKFMDLDAPTDPTPEAEAEPEATPEEPIVEEPAPAEEPAAETFDDLVKEEGGEPENNISDSTGMAQLAQALIDEKIILPFEGEEKKLEEYSIEDYKELLKMNFDNQKQQVQAETPKEFFEALPPELQYAAKYVADGGADLKGLFRALAASEETKSLSIDSETGQEHAARQFLQATNFGNDDEIQEQIDSWKDLGKLEDKAQQFKPKLDAMQESIVQRQIAEQEAKKQQREQQSQLYADSVYDTLAKGELNGLKMNPKVQNMLYSGLIQPNYQSVSGQPTNLFGHLIEKHQYVEPNHGLIAEALWLLADPDGYKSEISKGATNEAVEKTARQLKQEQSNKNAGADQPEPGSGKSSRPALQRAPKNFFKRD